VEALYASVSRECAIAEVDYAIAQQPVLSQKPRVISELQLRLSSVIDLSTAQAIETLGWSQSQLTAENWALPQKIDTPPSSSKSADCSFPVPVRTRPTL
jgi:RES domain-containing protein